MLGGVVSIVSVGSISGINVVDNLRSRSQYRTDKQRVARWKGT